MLQKTAAVELSNEATKPSFKSRPSLQKNYLTKRQNQFSKVIRCRKKLSNEATKSNLKSRSMVQKNV